MKANFVVKNKVVPITISTFFIILLFLTIWSTIHQSRTYVEQLIIQDLMKLGPIFEKINKTAKIKAVENNIGDINFLNVKKFAGSQIGPINLERPSNWQGPYLTTNPTIQEKFYRIINTDNGIFVVPPDDIQLANGKVIGKDILLDSNADIETMMKDKELLLSSYGSPLAIKLK